MPIIGIKEKSVHMVETIMQCNSCNSDLATEQDQKRGVCFKCHLKGIRFNFVGAQYGKSNWNTKTIKETQDMYANMPNVEKVSTRKELI